jgi:hypothetical protein
VILLESYRKIQIVMCSLYCILVVNEKGTAQRFIDVSCTSEAVLPKSQMSGVTFLLKGDGVKDILVSKVSYCVNSHIPSFVHLSCLY